MLRLLLLLGIVHGALLRSDPLRATDYAIHTLWVGLGIDYGMRAGHQLRYLRGRRPTPAAQPIDYTRRTSRRAGRWDFFPGDAFSQPDWHAFAA